MELRLNKYIQEILGISRRKFVNLVKQWLVFIDWKKIESYSFVLSGWEVLEIKSLQIKKKISFLKKESNLIIFNKPVGYVCSKSDKYNQTIYELLPERFQNYFYIGRLDKDSRGLLLMTNDSSLVHKYEHPSNKVEKEYIVQIDREFSINDYLKIKKWIKDDGDLLEVKGIKSFDIKKKTFVNVILWEWKKRHIRRILSKLWYNVLDLQRVREWNFKLGNVKEWNWNHAKG